MQQNNDDDGIIAGQLTYFNILAQSIMRLNEAIIAEREAHKDPMEAAEVMLTDIPTKWKKPIQESIDKAGKEYSLSLSEQQKFLVRGVNEERKDTARYEIFIAKKIYAKKIKVIVIDLLDEKDILYQTRKKVEQGRLSLVALGEGSDDDDN